MWTVRLGLVISALALIIPGTACLLFIVTGYARPLGEFAPLALTIFGVALALSATCYTVAPNLPEGDRGDSLYAGEKFLHSGLLFLQAISVKYAETVVVAWLVSHNRETAHAQAAAGILFTGTAAFGAYAFVYGFERLNDWLWARWVKRRGVIEQSKAKTDTPPK
jgi:hypothetical protein